MARRSTTGHARAHTTTTQGEGTVEGDGTRTNLEAPEDADNPEGHTETPQPPGEERRPSADPDRTRTRPERREVVIRPGKTSAAATFALVFGVSALITSLTVVLAPLGVLLGVIALVLGASGVRKAALPHLTGKGVAVGGIVTGVLGLLIGIAVVAGAFALLSDEGAVAELEQRLDDAGIQIQR